MSSASPTLQASALPAAAELRKRLTGYESSPGRLLRWAAVDWAIILTAWIVMARLEHPLVTILGVLTVASRLQALGALLHDACHSPVRSRAWPLVEAVAGWPIASTIAAMRYHHLRHHSFSGTTLDPYRNGWIDRGPIARALLVLRGAMLPVWWTLRAVVAPAARCSAPVRRFYARAFLQERSRGDVAESQEIFDCISADMRQLLAQTIVFAGAVLVHFPIVELYFIPWILAGIVNARRVLYEHGFGESTDSRRATVFAATNDHQFGPVLDAVVYPHNLGLHRAHHLYPTASFVHLPRLTAAVRNPGNQTNEVQPDSL